MKAGKATTDEIARLVQFTKEHGGIEYAVASMHRYRDEALAQLAGLADTDVRRALEAYVAYVVDRTNDSAPSSRQYILPTTGRPGRQGPARSPACRGV